jgi:hypothetical protein
MVEKSKEYKVVEGALPGGFVARRGSWPEDRAVMGVWLVAPQILLMAVMPRGPDVDAIDVDSLTLYWPSEVDMAATDWLIRSIPTAQGLLDKGEAVDG